MAYKYAKGKVYRGDIYNEDDTQLNTYLDWSEDAIGVVAGGATVFVVSGSTAAVGVGTTSPGSGLSACTLDVDMGASSPNKTYPVARFKNSGGPARVIIDAQNGSDARLYLADAGDIQWEIGNDENAHNFRIRDATFDTHLTITQAGTCEFGNDGDLTPLFGVGGTPTSTLHSHGSVATEVTTINGTSTTLGATHHTVLLGADNNTCTVALPAASGCTGRIYVLKRVGTGTTSVTSTDYIDGDDEATLDFETIYDIKTVQSNGTQWFIIGEVHMGEGP